MCLKAVIGGLLICLGYQAAFSQFTVKKFNPDSLSASYFAKLKDEFGNHKIYPVQYEKQILIALSCYPELKNTHITFRIKTRHAIALTRTSWGTIPLPAGMRHFVITISDSTETLLMPILFERQAFNAQVGVIGHELAHVVQYSIMNIVDLAEYAVNNISPRYLDKFEFNADAICIAHGLGFQLLEWSSFVRRKMKTVNWRGPDYVRRPGKIERYMNPSTILEHIAEDALYQVSR